MTEARRLLANEITTHPDNLHARYNMAVLLEQIDHDADAFELYKENMARGWHLPTVINLSQTYRQSGRLQEARELLEKASRRYRSESSPCYLLAEMAEESGNTSEADGWYRKALKADPLNGFAHLRFAAFLQRNGNLSMALKHSGKATKLLSQSPLSWQLHASVHEQAGDRKEALSAYQRSLALKPDSDVRQQMINLLRKMGQPERADQMQKALDAYLRHQQP